MDSFFPKKDIFEALDLKDGDLFFYSSTDSTNTRAREYFLESGALSPKLFVAREQTAGRGTRGRSFESADGGLYFSILLPDSELDSSGLTAMAAGAVYLSLSHFLTKGQRSPLFIKWVNDLYAGNKKIAGILSERIERDGNAAYIVGIGINLYGSPFSPEVERIAASVETSLGVRIEPWDLLYEIVHHLLSARERRGRRGLLRVYRKHSLKRGAPITVTSSLGISREATVKGLSRDLSLKVRYSDGKKASLISGDLSIRI